MKKVLNFFKDKRVISVIGLIALSIIIWFVGDQVRFGESNYAPLGSQVARLIAIMILLLIWGLNNLRAQVQRNKQNKELIEDIEDSQKQPENLLGGQSSEELEVLRDRFTQAMHVLRKMKFKGKQGNKAVYELPWYIIIGPPGSGKTTALVNSGLEFPLSDTVGKGALKGIGGTRNCDWWFTNEAVLIDTAGRYTTQDSHRVVDSAAWQGFLALLKRNRPRRPINGAIVSISIAELLIQTEEQRNQHARTIRNRIDELMEQLGVRFPIYVMFTKCDLVSGFSEFFEDMSRVEREQVWGVTFRDMQAASLSPDIDWFGSEFNLLIDRLNDRLLWRLHQERDVNRRGLIEIFPQQMEILKPILTGFMKQVFAPSRYHYQPYLRGAYFSSGTQDGTPIDRMMSAITASMGLQREQGQLQIDQGKSYFINQLFKNIIFQESELVGTNQKFERAMLWMRRGGFAALVVVFIAIISVWTTSVLSNKFLLRDVESSIIDFNKQKLKVASLRSGLESTLPALNSLRAASQVYDREQHPWLVKVGMYDSSVDDAAKKAYNLQLQKLFMPRIQQYLAYIIQQLLQQPDKKGELYDAFRLYYMFQSIEHLDPAQMSDWFSSEWEKTMHGEATKKNDLIAHLNSLLAEPLPVTELDARLVKVTRRELLKVPPSQRIYSRVKSTPKYAQKINLNNLFGDVLTNGFKVDHESSLNLPVLFTKDGYDDIDLDPDSELVSAILHDNWVLGEDAKTDFRKSDLKDISKQVKEYYLMEYASRWRTALASMKIADFTSLQQGVDMLAVMSDPVYSPIVSVLKTTSGHTTLTMQAMVGNPGENSDKSLIKSASSLVSGAVKGNRVDMTFMDLNKLSRGSSKRPPPIEKILQSIGEVHDYLNDITLASNQQKAAFDVAKTRFQTDGADAIKKLYAVASKAPKPVDTWLYAIADQSWKVILGSAKQHINAEWRTLVSGKYRNSVANRFPLTPAASQEITVTDFADFFKKGGTVDKFVTDYINPFVDVQRKWQIRSLNRRSMYFSSESLAQLQRAAMIKAMFFRTNPESPGLKFQLRPVSMDQSVTHFELQLGGQKVAYSHGPKFWQDVNWPGDSDNGSLRIRFVDTRDRADTKDYDGPWALFRLLREAKLSNTNTTNIYGLTFALDGRTAQFQLKADSVTNPFNTNVLSRFAFPEQL